MSRFGVQPSKPRKLQSRSCSQTTRHGRPDYRQSCYTVVYTLRGMLTSKAERRLLGEYVDGQWKPGILRAIPVTSTDEHRWFRIPLGKRTLGQVSRMLTQDGLNRAYWDMGTVAHTGTGTGEIPAHARSANIVRAKYRELRSIGAVSFQDTVVKVFGPDTTDLHLIVQGMDAIARETMGLGLAQVKDWQGVMADYIGAGMVRTLGTSDYVIWQRREARLIARGTPPKELVNGKPDKPTTPTPTPIDYTSPVQRILPDTDYGYAESKPITTLFDLLKQRCVKWDLLAYMA